MSPNSRNAYMAGLMDGEGSFSVSVTYETGKPHYAVNVRLYNTNQKIINWVINNYGGKPSWGDKNGGNIVSIKTHRKMCQWFLTGRKVMESFILSVLPYLIAKKEQANLVLQYIRMDGRHDPTARQAIADKVSALNNLQDTPTTNTQDDLLVYSGPHGQLLQINKLKIESELHSDMQSDSTVM